jgi:RNA polymerase sigma factor (sigma-70 family)
MVRRQLVGEGDRPDGARGAVDSTGESSSVWEDSQLLSGVRRRDADALARFFDVAFPYVYSLAYRLTGHREASEDIAQEVFLKVYRAADRLDVNRHAKPWITTITYNACRDVARRAARRPETSTDADPPVEVLQSNETPEDVFAKRERVRLVEAALRELDDLSRTVVILHDFCGSAHGEIAAIIGASEANVRKRYSRALSRMAKTIKRISK